MFGWLFWKKAPKEKSGVKDRNILYGHDLDKWNYLGHTEYKLTSYDGKAYENLPIFYFSKVSNDDIRSVKFGVTNDGQTKLERYFHDAVANSRLWQNGEFKLWQIVSRPSPYLKNFMLSKMGYEWSDETKWWVRNGQTKYKQAMAIQEEEKKPEIIDIEENVIQVDFKK